jgi:hypothetical protein
VSRAAYLLAFVCLALPPAILAEDARVKLALGGPRQVQAVVSTGPEEYAIEVKLLPVRCFDAATNARLNRDLGRRYALQALARHLSGKKAAAFTVSGGRVESAGGDGKSYTLTLRVPREGVRAVPAGRPRVATEVVAFDADLFTRKQDYLQTLDRLAAGLLADLEALQKQTTGPGKDEVFALGIADLEERGVKYLEQLEAEVTGDRLLLFTEKDEITAGLASARTRYLERLTQAVQRRPPKTGR